MVDQAGPQGRGGPLSGPATRPEAAATVRNVWQAFSTLFQNQRIVPYRRPSREASPKPCVMVVNDYGLRSWHTPPLFVHVQKPDIKCAAKTRTASLCSKERLRRSGRNCADEEGARALQRSVHKTEHNRREGFRLAGKVTVAPVTPSLSLLADGKSGRAPCIGAALINDHYAQEKKGGEHGVL